MKSLYVCLEVVDTAVALFHLVRQDTTSKPALPATITRLVCKPITPEPHSMIRVRQGSLNQPARVSVRFPPQPVS